MSFSKFLFFFALLSPPLWAQDYSRRSSTRDSKRQLPEEGPAQEVVAESNPELNIPQPEKGERLRSVSRFSVKVGGNYSFYEQSDIDVVNGGLDTTKYSGAGFDLMAAVGWDLRWQPVYIEFESGYRRIMMAEDPPLNVIPLGVGLMYRIPLGRQSWFKPGIRSSLDLRYVRTRYLDGTNVSDIALVPNFSVVTLLDLTGFLIEPSLALNRFQNGFNFFTLALRFGYRF